MVGSRPLWELWAEAQTQQNNRGQELLDAGAFTVMDFVKKTGWTRNHAKFHLTKLGLKSEIAYDPRMVRSCKVVFFFPPDNKKAPR